MAAAVRKPTIGIHYVPSLFHVAVVKIARPLFLNFHVSILKTVFADIQQENSTASNESRQESYIRAKERLLYIPGHLRKSVMEAVYGLFHVVSQFRFDLSSIFRDILEEKTFYWRYDGTPDRTKIVQKMVLDESLDITVRFSLACAYCFKESIRILWKELVESGKTEEIDVVMNLANRFWVRWLQQESQIPWTQAALEYLDTPRNYFSFSFGWVSPTTLPPRYNSFFPLLPIEGREKFHEPIALADFDDLRFCLYSMTDGEKEKLLKTNAQRVLQVYLEWPLQSLFLDIAEKMWNYIDVETFCNIVNYLLFIKMDHGDYAYDRLFESFWSRGPHSFQKAAKEIPNLREDIDLYFSKKRAN